MESVARAPEDAGQRKSIEPGRCGRAQISCRANGGVFFWRRRRRGRGIREARQQVNKSTPLPTEIKLHQVSRKLEIAFDDGTRFELPYEFLRVYSPSAEVRGHGPGQEVLQVGKQNIEIRTLEPVGSYAVQPPFSD